MLSLFPNDHTFYNHLLNKVSNNINKIYKLNIEAKTKELIYNNKDYKNAYDDDRSNRYNIDLMICSLELNYIIYIEIEENKKIYYKKLGDKILESME
jgi:hypothetical protein